MSYFPIIILLVDTDKVMLCKYPENIPSGMAFRVLHTRV